jgi:hypothetical protein
MRFIQRPPTGVRRPCGRATSRVLDGAIEWLPLFAYHLLIAGDNALCCHTQGMRLKAHFGGELALPLSSTVEPDRTIEVFVADIVRELAGRVLGPCDHAAVEVEPMFNYDKMLQRFEFSRSYV